jgi:hypothetical protein
MTCSKPVCTFYGKDLGKQNEKHGEVREHRAYAAVRRRAAGPGRSASMEAVLGQLKHWPRKLWIFITYARGSTH